MHAAIGGQRWKAASYVSNLCSLAVAPGAGISCAAAFGWPLHKIGGADAIGALQPWTRLVDGSSPARRCWLWRQ